MGENELAMTQVGTPVYMSPEVIQGLPYSSKSDIWASGCVLYELITRRKLFEYSNQLSLVMKIINREFQKMPNFNNPDLHDLLQKLLLQDPNQRPSATEILGVCYSEREYLLNFLCNSTRFGTEISKTTLNEFIDSIK